jgi:hypothetical protein
MNYQEPEQRYQTRAAMDTIALRMGWNFEMWMQDWPLEISDEIVIENCLWEYSLLQDDDEKFVLMNGILFALDHVVEGELFKVYCRQISALLKRDFKE